MRLKYLPDWGEGVYFLPLNVCVKDLCLLLFYYDMLDYVCVCVYILNKFFFRLIELHKYLYSKCFSLNFYNLDIDCLVSWHLSLTLSFLAGFQHLSSGPPALSLSNVSLRPAVATQSGPFLSLLLFVCLTLQIKAFSSERIFSSGESLSYSPLSSCPSSHLTLSLLNACVYFPVVCVTPSRV